MPKLRRLKLESLDQVIDEVTRLRDHPYSRGGQWNLSQLCEHLTGTMRIGLDGSVKPFPWLLRATLGNLMFWLFASRVVRGVNGMKTLPQLEPAPSEADDPEAIERCLSTLREARDRREPLPPYPFTTSITNDRWRQMMVVHSQHHLEFLKPIAG
ncbi:hypothetical protein Pla108_27990 [Botrimarina colliarenosi]|uniref:DinB superfamily protein n=1 Tax=Botrimarina colliarenosi TaxID=2528001 RepID=A0A5C6AAG4_9BACT|nr:DUF1569 domain-containing protein [Botrimarina colliarenosi]TWT97022.1 hypothetical protein Pla108_27990 [Botrimarina colliarenosi]